MALFIIPIIICFVTLLIICYIIDQKIERLCKKLEDEQSELKENIAHKILPNGKPSQPINTRGMSC